jgi:hypothetical protein
MVHGARGLRAYSQGGSMQTLLIAAVIVFILNAAGSFIEFNNRFVNALVDTVLFAIVFGVLMHLGYLHMDFSGMHAAATAPTPATTP